MAGIAVESDFWMNRIYPESLMENWLAPDGGTVAAGQAVAVAQIERAPITLTPPISGILSIHMTKNNAVGPGTIAARIL